MCEVWHTYNLFGVCSRVAFAYYFVTTFSMFMDYRLVPSHIYGAHLGTHLVCTHQRKVGSVVTSSLVLVMIGTQEYMHAHKI